MRLFLLIILVLAGAAVWTNPGPDDFSTYVESRTRDKLMEQAGDTDLGRALSSLGSSLAGSFSQKVTERKNYLVFSVYTLDLDGPDASEGDWKFLGAAGSFYELNRPESVQVE